MATANGVESGWRQEAGLPADHLRGRVVGDEGDWQDSEELVAPAGVRLGVRIVGDDTHLSGDVRRPAVGSVALGWTDKPGACERVGSGRSRIGEWVPVTGADDVFVGADQFDFDFRVFRRVMSDEEIGFAMQ